MKYPIITIEREYASGGREIGKRLAQTLGAALYGTEILQMAAQERGVSVEYLEHLEETATSSLLYSFYVLSQAATGGAAGKRPLADELYLLEKDIIRRLAAQGPAVFIGRCAGAVLAERQGVLRVFVHAGADSRRARACAEYGDAPETVAQTLRQIDRRRENYYTANTGKKWRDSDNYDLVLDSTHLGTARCAALLAACAE